MNIFYNVILIMDFKFFYPPLNLIFSKKWRGVVYRVMVIERRFPIDNNYRVPRGFLFTYSLNGYVLGETTVPVVKVKGNSDSGLKIISKSPAL